MLFSGSEVICLLVCPTLHTYAQYVMAEKKELAEVLLLEEVTILACSVFVGHG